MTKYKKDDKVVVEISGIANTPYGEHTAFVCNNSQYLPDEAILGKLEDFQSAEKKIVMAPDEKAEFDDLYPDTFQDVSDFLNDIYNFPDNYPNLKKRLYSNDRTNNFHSQIEFVKALEKPNLIEVEKEKKYYVHLLENDPCGYLKYDVLAKEYFIGSKGESYDYKAKFTKDEIAKMHFDNFKFTNKALEEVEDE